MVVLLVEDDDAVRTLVAALLEKDDFSVLQACNGEEALKLARTHAQIDLVLTDVEMGKGLNGFELVSRIRAGHLGLPILVMSGFPDNEGVAAENGIPFLRKPFTPTTLRKRIQEMAIKIPAQSEHRATLNQVNTCRTQRLC